MKPAALIAGATYKKLQKNRPILTNQLSRRPVFQKTLLRMSFYILRHIKIFQNFLALTKNTLYNFYQDNTKSGVRDWPCDRPATWQIPPRC
jgi:hypothetical protein